MLRFKKIKVDNKVVTDKNGIPQLVRREPKDKRAQRVVTIVDIGTDPRKIVGYQGMWRAIAELRDGNGKLLSTAAAHGFSQKQAEKEVRYRCFYNMQVRHSRGLYRVERHPTIAELAAELNTRRGR